MKVDERRRLLHRSHYKLQLQMNLRNSRIEQAEKLLHADVGYLFILFLSHTYFLGSATIF